MGGDQKAGERDSARPDVQEHRVSGSGQGNNPSRQGHAPPPHHWEEVQGHTVHNHALQTLVQVAGVARLSNDNPSSKEVQRSVPGGGGGDDPGDDSDGGSNGDNSDGDDFGKGDDNSHSPDPHGGEGHQRVKGEGRPSSKGGVRLGQVGDGVAGAQEQQPSREGNRSTSHAETPPRTTRSTRVIDQFFPHVFSRIVDGSLERLDPKDLDFARKELQHFAQQFDLDPKDLISPHIKLQLSGVGGFFTDLFIGDNRITSGDITRFSRDSGCGFIYSFEFQDPTQAPPTRHICIDRLLAERLDLKQLVKLFILVQNCLVRRCVDPGQHSDLIAKTIIRYSSARLPELISLLYHCHVVGRVLDEQVSPKLKDFDKPTSKLCPEDIQAIIDSGVVGITDCHQQNPPNSFCHPRYIGSGDNYCLKLEQNKQDSAVKQGLLLHSKRRVVKANMSKPHSKLSSRKRKQKDGKSSSQGNRTSFQGRTEAIGGGKSIKCTPCFPSTCTYT